MSYLQRGFESPRQFAETLLGGAYLILHYVMTLWLVVGALSAIQVRDSHEEGTLPFTFGYEDTATAEEYLLNTKTRITSALYFGEVSEPENRMFRMVDGTLEAFPEQIRAEDFYELSDFINSYEFNAVEAQCGPQSTIVGCQEVRQLRSEYISILAQKESGKIPSQAEVEAQALTELDNLREFTEFVDLNVFFDTIEDVPRWGIRLKEALEKAEVVHRDIALYLQVDETKAKDIVSGGASATVVQQKLIAACLRINPREIFTDQPPRAVVIKTSTSAGT